MSSRLVGSTTPEQIDVPGTTSQSDQVRTSAATTIGLYRAANAVESCSMYRPNENLRAVLLSPNRSYAAPRRGDQFFQFGMLRTAAKSLAGTNRPSGAVCSSIL